MSIKLTRKIRIFMFVKLYMALYFHLCPNKSNFVEWASIIGMEFDMGRHYG